MDSKVTFFYSDVMQFQKFSHSLSLHWTFAAADASSNATELNTLCGGDFKMRRTLSFLISFLLLTTARYSLASNPASSVKVEITVKEKNKYPHRCFAKSSQSDFFKKIGVLSEKIEKEGEWCYEGDFDGNGVKDF